MNNAGTLRYQPMSNTQNLNTIELSDEELEILNRMLLREIFSHFHNPNGSIRYSVAKLTKLSQKLSTDRSASDAIK